MKKKEKVKRKVGRPTDYNKDVCRKVDEYLDTVATNGGSRVA
jgi:hypothetical protein